MKIPDELNCRANRSRMVHILEKPRTPKENVDTLCGRRLHSGFYIFPMSIDPHFYRCKICLQKYKEENV